FSRSLLSFPTRRSSDLTIYDFDLVQYGDGSVGIMFLLVNRLDKTISDIELVMTFKDEDGTVVFDEEYIELPESYLGQLEPHSVVDRKSTRLNSSHVSIS